MDGLAGWAVDTANVGLHECRAVDTANQMDGLCGLDGWLFTCPKGFLLLFGHVFEHRDWPLAEPFRRCRSLVSAAIADILCNVKRPLLRAAAFLAGSKATICEAFFCRGFILSLFFCCAAACSPLRTYMLSGGRHRRGACITPKKQRSESGGEHRNCTV